ncbi:PQQ-dependent sugar dehydrogenase [Cytophaga aurantiaca]|uniref:PQQ-dependent sugar dehydrogenase n=1 Tax=Cytophaga aurantiaca TaxID=29530 RepID=UPI00035C829C|nr:PQQ-dependent sugar dehydrogenase [Cytophaga aurantiaca]
MTKTIYSIGFRIFSLYLMLYALPNAAQSLKPDAKKTIIVQKGFDVITIVPSLGRARHITVDSNGTIYVRMNEYNIDGKGIVVLKDTDGDGRADIINSFGDFTGTGIALYKNYLYASSDSVVYRFPLTATGIDASKLDTIVNGLPYNPQHGSKNIVIAPDGKLYVNIGAPSNACQEVDRTKGSKGMDPCPLLETYGGIWQFDANKLNQKQSDGIRYASGLRNCVAMDWDILTKHLYALPHGRDQLNTLYPEFYSNEQNAELPSEELFQITKGTSYGWPYCYFDHLQNKKLLSPEYGGDSKITGRCDTMPKPIIAFPGHWAPNDLLFYHGNMFPEKYKHGVFIAFHGSWNRAPLKQGGYFVAFVPMKDGKPTGTWEVFAEGFAGGKEITSPNDAKHRPMGLAEGPDGSLYISDSVAGTIYRIIYVNK